MIDPTSMVASPQDVPIEPFAETSRYRGLPILKWTGPDGREHAYVDRRIVPPPANFAEVGRVVVQEGDRIDNIASQQLGDPQLYWRLADANAALHPAELTARIGRKLRIVLPEGLPGPRGE